MILTTKGGHEFQVSGEDAERVSRYTWYRTRTTKQDGSRGKWYIRRLIDPTDCRSKVQYLHRFITGAPKGKVVDHLNGDPCDNRRENLKVCTHKENLFNNKRRRDGLIWKETVCDLCGEKTVRRTGEVNRRSKITLSGRLFCSAKCSNVARSKSDRNGRIFEALKTQTLEDVAKAHGITAHQLRCLVRQHGQPTPTSEARKKIDEFTAELKRLHASGISKNALSKRFGVSYMRIYRHLAKP